MKKKPSENSLIINISARAFAKYLARIPTNTTEFFNAIYPALKQSIKDKNSNVLKTRLAECALKMEPEIFYLCLKATKDFLNGRDCQYEGKYQSKNFFFGGIKLISSAPLLQSLNAVIDDMIAKQSNPEFIHKSQSANRYSIWSSGYQVFKSGVKIFTSRPIILLNAILSYQTQMIYAANAMTTNKVELDQCPATLSTTSFLQQASQLMPYEYTKQDIHTFYHIYQNTKTPLDQVKIFLFGEKHENKTHHSLRKYFVSVLGKPGDYVLFEGVSSELTVPCEQLEFDIKFICKGWEKYSLHKEVHDQIFPNMHIVQQFIKENKKLSLLSKSIMNEFIKIHEMRSQLLAESERLIRLLRVYEKEKLKWFNTLNEESSEEWNIYVRKRLKNIDINNGKIQSRVKELLALISDITVIAGNSLLIRAEITNALDSMFARSVEAAKTAKYALSGEKCVKERNREGIIASLENLKNTQGSIFVLGGIAHFASARARNGNDLGILDESDYQYELRDAISEIPYAVLYPR